MRAGTHGKSAAPSFRGRAMDIEFHHDLTYLVAARAGYAPRDAATIAHAAQLVDDNNVRWEIGKGGPDALRNYISQTMNIARPRRELFRVYCLFHFVPGDPAAPAAQRRDGAMHRMVATPGAAPARRALAAARASGNLHRVGVAAHAFADTWAHQNFVGVEDRFNAMPGLEAAVSPNVGHADAGFRPDWPALAWEDDRLQESGVDNRARFLDAAAELLVAFGGREADAPSLRADFDAAIGPPDPRNRNVAARRARYAALAGTTPYGAAPLPRYDRLAWLEDAAAGRVRMRRRLLRPLPLLQRLVCRGLAWADPAAARATDWWLFQQGVREHQAFLTRDLFGGPLAGVVVEGF